MPDGIVPGDKVVALAAAAQTAALLAGGFAGAISMWITRHKPALSCAGFVGGAIAGLVVGMFTGRLLFPTSGGNVVIAKAGPGSLALTLKGNLAASLVAAVAVCAVSALVTGTNPRTLAPVAVISSVVIGAGCALLASLA